MVDNALELLSHPDRERMVSIMSESEEDVFDYDEIAESLSSDKEKATAKMVHQHLPKLEEYGVLEYDQRSETIKYDGTKDVEELLDGLQDMEYVSL